MMGPFDIRKPGQSKWMAGLLHAEGQVAAGNRELLEGNVECSRCFGDFEDFDRGIEDYLSHIDHRVVTKP